MKISIPTPCSENWDQMLPDEKGKFCLSCQKCVLDFTKIYDEEILKYAGEKDICVKINKNQILQINSRSDLNFIFPKWIRYSSIFMILGFGSISSAQINTELKYTTSQIEELQKKDTLIRIKLQLVDDFNEDPISGAKVYLDKKKKKYSTFTDENGYFELEVPTKYLDNYLIIESEYLNRAYQIRYILNQNKIGNEMYLGRIDFKQSSPLSFLNSIYKFFA